MTSWKVLDRFLISYLKGNAVEVSSTQYPALYEHYLECCRKLEIEAPPREDEAVQAPPISDDTDVTEAAPDIAVADSSFFSGRSS